ncbi:ABC transporter permease [Clostridium sp. chh4-2]|uniref:permease-like cell division protein FtsX n=1 Tax=Clostridium sp. chh4-2 TaxID=2067550 RepID=UPI000CCF18F4|nr:permease-like cell division protein FtsX [Clostridium sp. chh4-2]PNV63225.1 ABC transporter permease [Clostridium sp. chh4-2]
MRISTFWYCLKQGVINICRNILFSLASVATISACIFLFCLFYAIIMNVQNVVHNAETTVGITVFFKEDLTESQIEEIGDQIRKRPEIKTMEFTSAEKAWDDFKQEYFSGMESLAEGFADDNPLAGSASYKIFLNDIETQDQVVSFIAAIPGVRKVNYSNSAAAGLSSFNKMIGLLSLVIIGVLLAVAMFLISNTISVAAAFRKHENQIMRLIGATNYMIRAPFVVEGVVIGLVGAVLPLVGMYYLYKNAIVYVQQKFLNLSGIMVFLPIEELMPSMMAVSLVLGAGIGFVVSFFTIRKHLKI